MLVTVGRATGRGDVLGASVDGFVSVFGCEALAFAFELPPLPPLDELEALEGEGDFLLEERDEPPPPPLLPPEEPKTMVGFRNLVRNI